MFFCSPLTLVDWDLTWQGLTPLCLWNMTGTRWETCKPWIGHIALGRWKPLHFHKGGFSHAELAWESLSCITKWHLWVSIKLPFILVANIPAAEVHTSLFCPQLDKSSLLYFLRCWGEAREKSPFGGGRDNSGLRQGTEGTACRVVLLWCKNDWW